MEEQHDGSDAEDNIDEDDHQETFVPKKKGRSEEPKTKKKRKLTKNEQFIAIADMVDFIKLHAQQLLAAC